MKIDNKRIAGLFENVGLNDSVLELFLKDEIFLFESL